MCVLFSVVFQKKKRRREGELGEKRENVRECREKEREKKKSAMLEKVKGIKEIWEKRKRKIGRKNI